MTWQHHVDVVVHLASFPVCWHCHDKNFVERLFLHWTALTRLGNELRHQLIVPFCGLEPDEMCSSTECKWQPNQWKWKQNIYTPFYINTAYIIATHLTSIAIIFEAFSWMSWTIWIPLNRHRLTWLAQLFKRNNWMIIKAAHVLKITNKHSWEIGNISMRRMISFYKTYFMSRITIRTQ